MPEIALPKIQLFLVGAAVKNYIFHITPEIMDS